MPPPVRNHSPAQERRSGSAKSSAVSVPADLHEADYEKCCRVHRARRSMHRSTAQAPYPLCPATVRNAATQRPAYVRSPSRRFCRPLSHAVWPALYGKGFDDRRAFARLTTAHASGRRSPGWVAATPGRTDPPTVSLSDVNDPPCKRGSAVGHDTRLHGSLGSGSS
jgi:hypothetical protein